MSSFKPIYRSNLTDVDLLRFWSAMQAEGKDRVWGLESKPMTGQDFVDVVRSRDSLMLGVEHEGIPLGIALLDNIQGKRGYIHFLTLNQGTKRLNGIPLLLAAGRWTMATILHEKTRAGTYRFDTIIGITPETIRNAAKFVSKLSGGPYTYIPDYFYMDESHENVGGIVNIFSRENVPEEWKRI